MDIEIAVVPVAGRGTRLFPLTRAVPKELLPLGRKPVLDWIVDELVRTGTRRLAFVNSDGKEAIDRHFGRCERDSVRTGREERPDLGVYRLRQFPLLGLGHAVLQAREFVGDRPFVVALGDAVIGKNGKSDVLARMKALFEEERAAAVIAFEEVPESEVSSYGIACTKSEGKTFEVTDLVEKPPRDEAPSRLAIAARYVLSPAIFPALAQTKPGKGGEIQLTDAIRALLESGGKVFGVRLEKDEKRYDIGGFESYYEAFLEFALADAHEKAAVRKFMERALDEDRS